MTTTTTMRPMPTEADVAEIWTIAEAYTGSRWISDVTATSGGVLVRYAYDLSSPAPALEAVGYATVPIRRGLVLVTGAVDQVALLDAQITALTRRRAELLAEREDEDEAEFADRMGFEARMGGPF